MSQDNFYNIYENNSGIGLSDFRQREWFVDLGDVVRTRVPVKMRQNQSDLVNRNKMPMIRLSEMYYIAAEARLTVDLATVHPTAQYCEKEQGHCAGYSCKCRPGYCCR